MEALSSLLHRLWRHRLFPRTLRVHEWHGGDLWCRTLCAYCREEIMPTIVERRSAYIGLTRAEARSSLEKIDGRC